MNLKSMLDDFDFEVGPWGSCQYAQANHVFNVFRETVTKVGLKTTIELFEQALGCKITAPERTCHEFSPNHKLLAKAVRESYEDDDDGYLADDFKLLEEAKSVEEVFLRMRKLAWDLWSAANVAACTYGIVVDEAPQAPGTGPEWNILAQGQNYTTGIQCALLVELGCVSDTDVFVDFDT